MKTSTIKPFIYAFLFIGLAAIHFYASGGAAQVQGADRTGSPLSNSTCALCHTDGAFDPALEVKILNSAQEEVTEFVAGESYDITLTISASGAAAYGFQLVALAPDNTNAGELSTDVDNTAIRMLGDVMYAEQSGRMSTSEFAIQWTAPEAVDSVTFYAVANAVNGNGNTGGDGVVNTAIGIASSPVASFTKVTQLGIAQFPNPVVDIAQFTFPSSQSFELEIFDNAGKRIANQTVTNTLHQELVHEYASGTYYWRATNGNGFQSGKFIKL